MEYKYHILVGLLIIVAGPLIALVSQQVSHNGLGAIRKLPQLGSGVTFKAFAALAITLLFFTAILIPGEISAFCLSVLRGWEIPASLWKLFLMGATLILVAIFVVNQDNWLSRVVFTLGLLFVFVSFDGGISSWMNEESHDRVSVRTPTSCRGEYAKFLDCKPVTLVKGRYHITEKPVPIGQCLAYTKKNAVVMEDLGARRYRLSTSVDKITVYVFKLRSGQSNDGFTCGKGSSDAIPYVPSNNPAIT